MSENTSQYVSLDEYTNLISMLDEYSKFLASKRISSAIDQLMALPSVKSTPCGRFLQKIKKQVVNQALIPVTDSVSYYTESPLYQWSVLSVQDSEEALLMNALGEEKKCVGAVEKLERNLRRWCAARDFKSVIIDNAAKSHSSHNSNQRSSHNLLCSDESFREASIQFVERVGADTQCTNVLKQIQIVLREIWHGVSTAARSLVGKNTRFFDTVAHREISECVSAECVSDIKKAQVPNG